MPSTEPPRLGEQVCEEQQHSCTRGVETQLTVLPVVLGRADDLPSERVVLLGGGEREVGIRCYVVMRRKCCCSSS
jgi:hypothetical protein